MPVTQLTVTFEEVGRYSRVGVSCCRLERFAEQAVSSNRVNFVHVHVLSLHPKMHVWFDNNGTSVYFLHEWSLAGGIPITSMASRSAARGAPRTKGSVRAFLLRLCNDATRQNKHSIDGGCQWISEALNDKKKITHNRTVSLQCPLSEPTKTQWS